MPLRLTIGGSARVSRLPTAPFCSRCPSVQRTAHRGPQVRVQCTDRTMADLQAELNLAISEENYATAARLRDQLSNSKHDSRAAVEEAQRKFYEAFENGDLEAMDKIWGKSDVMDSWKVVLAGAKRGMLKVSISDVRTVASDTQAFVTCLETVDAGDSRGRVIATNCFEKQDGQWKIVHHHGSGTPF